jgi:hypothetical protein
MGRVKLNNASGWRKADFPADRAKGASQFLNHRRAKHQAPNPKLQRSSKSQNTKPPKTDAGANGAQVGF